MDRLLLYPFTEMFRYTVTVIMWMLLGLIYVHWPHRTELEPWFLATKMARLLYSDFAQNWSVWRNIPGKWAVGPKCQKECVGDIQSPNLVILKCNLNISSSFIYCCTCLFLSVWVEGPWRGGHAPVARLSVNSYWVTMRFSWPGICNILGLFGGVSMTKSSVWTPLQGQYKYRSQLQLGGKAEMRFKL